MSHTLKEIAEKLQASDKKVQLIYAFNGTGKTRLSREFKNIVDDPEDNDRDQPSKAKILYYNAFTEDLFTWKNDQNDYVDHSIVIRNNGLTEWLLPLLAEQGLVDEIRKAFQEHTNTKIIPVFNEDYSEVRFKLALDAENNVSDLKVSRGEESNFVWSIFYVMLDLAISVLSEEVVSNRETSDFNVLEYVFIDDPVSSLDDNHLIHSAVSIAKLVKKGSANLKFIISTHNPLFFNILSNEFGNDRWDKDQNGKRYWKRDKFIKYQMQKLTNGTLNFDMQPSDSPFSYHIHIKEVLKKVIDDEAIEKFHFNLLRNLLEKTATFLGHCRWEMLLPKNDNNKPDEQCMRALNIYSHSQESGDQVPNPTPAQLTTFSEIFHHLIETYQFKR